MTITIKCYIEAAQAKGWSFEWIDRRRNVIALHPPDEQPILISNNITELNSAIGARLSDLKSSAATLAKKTGFLVPQTLVIEENETYEKGLSLLKSAGRVVVKPMDGAFGNGVSTNVTDGRGLQRAIEYARGHNIKSRAVIVQEFCEGSDHRLFILAGELIAAIERSPLSLLGDGIHTIDELLDNKVTALLERADSKVKPVDVNKQAIIKQLHTYTADSVLKQGEKLSVGGVANLSKGGEASDVTEIVHPAVIKKAVDLASLLRLDMCAVDVLSSDISQHPDEVHTNFIEVNAAPGFRGHYYPTTGKPRELAPLILDTILKKRQEKSLLQKRENNV